MTFLTTNFINAFESSHKKSVKSVMWDRSLEYLWAITIAFEVAFFHGSYVEIEVGVIKGLWEEGLDKLLVLEGFPNTLSQILKLSFENKLFKRFHFSAYQIFEIQKLVRFINKIFQVRALTLQFQRGLT